MLESCRKALMLIQAGGTGLVCVCFAAQGNVKWPLSLWAQRVHVCLISGAFYLVSVRKQCYPLLHFRDCAIFSRNYSEHHLCEDAKE